MHTAASTSPAADTPTAGTPAFDTRASHTPASHTPASNGRPAPRRRARSRVKALTWGGTLCLAVALTACGSDADTAATTVPTTAVATTAAPAPTPTPTTAKPAPTTTKPTPTTAKPAPTTAKPTTPTTAHVNPAGPEFMSFDVTRSAKCASGNAEFTMAYTTKDVVDMSIDIGSTGFKETAGYGPNETGVVASVPCSGAGQSTIQMKGCSASGACAESSKVAVTIEAG